MGESPTAEATTQTLGDIDFPPPKVDLNNSINVTIINDDFEIVTIKDDFDLYEELYTIDIDNLTADDFISVPFHLPLQEEDEEDFDESAEIFNLKSYTGLYYVPAFVSNVEFIALVDSGASKTFINSSVRDKLLEAGYKMNNNNILTVLTPLGASEQINQSFEIPLRIDDQIHTIVARVLPSMTTECIIGKDTLRIFGFNLHFGTDSYAYDINPNKYYNFKEVMEFNALYLINDKDKGIQTLTDKQRQELKKLLDEEIVIPEVPKTTNLPCHHIDVGDSEAIKQRYYPVSGVVEEALYKEVDLMLEKGIIEPSNSDWSSPIVMVKQGVKYRFCLDYRKVNAVTKKDAYPLPFMNIILDRLRSAKYISTIDLTRAFHQVPLTPESKPITAFTVPGKGLFQFVTMPFGL